MDFPLNTGDKWNSFIEELEKFNVKINETINKQIEQIKASKMKIKLDSKFAMEAKLNAELIQQLSQLKLRSSELERVCTSFESLSIAENDKNRLQNAEDMYQVAKELTGVRPDFSAPPNILTGFVKNEAQKLLVPFDYNAKQFDSEELWNLIRNTSSKGWPAAVDKENIFHNKI